MDFSATKGVEYLLVIGFLVLMVLYFRYALVSAAVFRRSTVRSGMRALGVGVASWFQVPEGFYFHRGHTWALPEGNDIYRVGMDDFANRLIGSVERLELPSPGDPLEQGEAAWSVQADGHSVDLLAPVRGQVVEVNHSAISNPGLLRDAPYGEGWLLRVKVDRPASTLKNLLTPRLAAAWMQDAVRQLNRWMEPDLGPVLQDGGFPMHGFARQVAGENWPKMAAELLLTQSAKEDAPSSQASV